MLGVAKFWMTSFRAINSARNSAFESILAFKICEVGICGYDRIDSGNALVSENQSDGFV